MLDVQVVKDGELSIMNLNAKYRPKVFEEVIGQDDIIRHLQYDVVTNNISPAYLFVGGSGMGKTTTAKILANMLNGETIEVDAASNNSAESMRTLIESTKTKPLGKNFYIIIIDEAHSASSQAWQVLLSTLEYPAYRRFIFCTTEVEKVPKTIYNRCIVHTFNPVDVTSIQSRLKDICQSEHFKYTEDALDLIACLAKGSVRQAITILDAIKDNDEISNKCVRQYIGNGTYDTYLNILWSISDTNYGELVKDINEITNIDNFIAGFFTFILDVNVYGKTKQIKVVNIPNVYEEDLKSLTDKDYAIAKLVLDKLYDLQFLGKHSPILKQLFLGMCYLICESLKEIK